MAMKNGYKNEQQCCYINAAKYKPISVAREQCGIVGQNSMEITHVLEFNGFTFTPSSHTMLSCSRVSGLSGSRMSRIKSAHAQVHPFTEH